jgi:hypothetical protein
MPPSPQDAGSHARTKSPPAAGPVVARLRVSTQRSAGCLCQDARVARSEVGLDRRPRAHPRCPGGTGGFRTRAQVMAAASVRLLARRRGAAPAHVAPQRAGAGAGAGRRPGAERRRDHVPVELIAGCSASTGRTLTPEEQRDRDELVKLLEEHGGNVSAVARPLGKDRTQVVRWIARSRIDARKPR